MRQTLIVSGITCEACEYKIKHLFSAIAGVESLEINPKTGEVHIGSQQNLDKSLFEQALKPYPKYSLSAPKMEEIAPAEKSWAATYKPILLIFSYITATSALLAWQLDGGLMLFMRGFMAAFFLLFSFFKMLDLRAFADSYQMYDLVAKKIPVWGLLYPFVELFLGLAYLVDFQPFVTNLVCLSVMSVSLLGVLQSVLNKNKIRCACLGSVFNLPMSTVTIIEDGLMVLMAAFMLIW